VKNHVGYINIGVACGAGNAYSCGTPDFTSGFHRGSCCPVIFVSLLLCYSLVCWILSFDCSFCLIAWYLYFFYYFCYSCIL